MTADCFDLLGDREGAAPLSALERHVFEKMRDTIDLGGLVPRANIDPDAERDRVDRLHAVGGYPQSVGQGRELRCHALLRSEDSGAPRMSADISRYRAGIVWQHCEALAPFQKVAEDRWQFRTNAGCAFDCVGKLCRMGASEGDHWRTAGDSTNLCARGGYRNRAVRIDQHARSSVSFCDGLHG